MTMLSVVRSVYNTNAEILAGIERLHCPGGFECDVALNVICDCLTQDLTKCAKQVFMLIEPRDNT
jgi:hypothetical protein